MRTTLALMWLIVGCGSEPPPVHSDAGIVVDVDTGPPARRAEIAVTVTHPAPGTLTDEPLAGATVGIAQAGEAVAETTTGPDGVARVEVDWSRGPIAVTAFSPEHVAQTRVQVDETSALALHLSWITGRGELAHVTGAILGGEPGSNIFVAASIAPIVSYSLSREHYDLGLARGRPFVVVGYEYRDTSRPRSPRGFGYDVLRWSVMEVEALGETPTVRDLDLDATAVAPAVATSRVLIPGGPSGPLGATSRAFVTVRSSWESDGFQGVQSLCDVDATSTAFDCEVTYVDVDHESVDPLVRYSVASRDGESGAQIAGLPVDGAILDVLPELPVVEPGTIDAGSVIAVVVPTPGFERLTLRVTGASGGYLWSLDAPAGATSIEVPPLPAALAEAASTWGIHGGYVEACYDIHPDSGDCGRYASGTRLSSALP